MTHLMVVADNSACSYDSVAQVEKWFAYEIQVVSDQMVVHSAGNKMQRAHYGWYVCMYVFSWVALAQDLAWKLKAPIVLG